MSTIYQPVADHFSYDTFNFQMLARQGDVALFAKWKSCNREFLYEVVIIRKRPAETKFGQDLPARELMPANEEWGTYGWTPVGWDGAWAKFRAIVAEKGDPEAPFWGLPTSGRYRAEIPEELKHKVYPPLKGGTGRQPLWQN